MLYHQRGEVKLRITQMDNINAVRQGDQTSSFLPNFLTGQEYNLEDCMRIIMIPNPPTTTWFKHAIGIAF